jgi:Protein of unknown function (DUF5672)
MLGHERMRTVYIFALLVLFTLWTLKFYYQSPPLDPSIPPPGPAFKIPKGSPLSPDLVATIIENRPLTNLIPLVLHFASVLGPSWPIRIFHNEDNAEMFNSSRAFAQAVASGQVSLHSLPEGTDFKSHDAVSRFLAGSSWFWRELAPAKHILLFQADSILCSNSPHRVEEFLEYDFIGAPINPRYGAGYNGGLSLRNRKVMLDTVAKYNWTKGRGFEDQWFYKRLNESGARLPSPDVAKRFSIETIWYERPLGLHQIQRWQKSKLRELAEWCPEYRLTDDGGIYKSMKGVH